MDLVIHFFNNLLNSSHFPPRWLCGNWDSFTGWLYVGSDLAIWSAYFAIPVILFALIRQRKDVPFSGVFLLFAGFILACGTTHLMDALMFWWPAYRLSGLVKFITAVVSWLTVFALIRIAPRVLSLRTTAELERMIQEHGRELNVRTKALEESEAQFRTLNDGIKDYAILALDARGHILTWNFGAERLYGYKESEVISQPYSCLFPQDERLSGKQTEELRITAALGRYDGEGIQQRKDLSRFWASVTTTAQYNQEGELTGYFKIVRDVTARKQAESELQVSESKLRAIVDTAIDAIITIDKSGQIVFFNHAAEKLFSYTPLEVLGHNINMLMPAPYHDEHDSYLVNYLSTGINIGREVMGVRKDGSTFHMELSVSEVLLEQGQLFTGIIRDITERKKAEAALLDSESRMRAVLETTVDAIITIDEQARILSFNQAATQLFDYMPAEVIGKNVKMLMPAPYHEEHDRYLENYRNTGIKKIIGIGREVMALRKDGQTFPIEVSVSEVQLKEQRIFTGIIRDITQRKLAEFSLEEGKERFRTLADNIPNLVWMAHADGSCFWYNKQWYDYTGTKPEDMEGWGWKSVHDPDILPQVMERWQLSLEKGEPFEMTFPLKGANGLFRPFLTRVLPVRDTKNQVVRWFGTNTDITEQKKAEAEIKMLSEDLEQRVLERTAQLETVNKELEAFSYSVSHDLRAPLRTIDGFSQGLLKRYSDQLDEKGCDYLKRIRQGTQQMGQLIDDMLQLSRLSRGSLNLTENVPLGHMAEEVAQNLKEQEPERQIEFKIASDIQVYGDQRLLQTVLENLIGNAWKYTSKHLRARIEFGCIPGSKPMIYYVSDDGAGFDMEYADKLFGAFQRLHGVSEFPGTGVGLASVARIIHRHGGEIWPQAQLEKGATFYFTLQPISLEEKQHAALYQQSHPVS